MDEHRDLYKNGKIGDVAIKKKLIEVLNALIDPIRTRRKQFEARPMMSWMHWQIGTRKANIIAEETLTLAKKAMRQDFFARELKM